MQAAPTPTTGETGYRRHHPGHRSGSLATRDDPVIARADGSVLYNFAVAVDDAQPGITHVVRGEDHISNTPHPAVGVRRTRAVRRRSYAHLPLLHGPDGRKLSKRHGAASVQELRGAGYLPEAVDNYIALLGRGFRRRRGVLHTARARPSASVSSGSPRIPPVFDERKLRHLNGRHLRELDNVELTRRLEEFTGRPGWRARSRSLGKRSRPWRTSGRWCRSCSMGQ